MLGGGAVQDVAVPVAVAVAVAVTVAVGLIGFDPTIRKHWKIQWSPTTTVLPQIDIRHNVIRHNVLQQNAITTQRHNDTTP